MCSCFENCMDKIRNTKLTNLCQQNKLCLQYCVIWRNSSISDFFDFFSIPNFIGFKISIISSTCITTIFRVAYKYWGTGWYALLNTCYSFGCLLITDVPCLSCGAQFLPLSQSKIASFFPISNLFSQSATKSRHTLANWHKCLTCRQA